MADGQEDGVRDLGSLVVPVAGALVETGDPWEPYYLSDPCGDRVGPVSEFLRDLQAAGRPAATQRSYSLALLRWFRFTWAVGVPWNQATRVEARDFCRWIQLADKPRSSRGPAAPVPGRRPASAKYAPSTVAHCETVCRGFYAYHLQAGTAVCASQPDGPLPAAEVGLVPAAGSPPGPEADPGRGVQRAVRPAVLAPGPGAGGVLGLRRRPGVGAPRRRALRRRPRAAADHRDPQGIAGRAAAPGITGRVRVAAPLPAGDARAGAVRAGRSPVVDAAEAVPAAELPRGQGDVRPGERRSRRRVVAPCPASHGRLPARP